MTQVQNGTEKRVVRKLKLTDLPHLQSLCVIGSVSFNEKQIEVDLSMLKLNQKLKFLFLSEYLTPEFGDV